MTRSSFPNFKDLRDKAPCLVLLALALSPVWGQEATPPIPEKAKRYHELLLKRPQPGTVFERFVSEWLTEGSVEDLRLFLEKQAENPEAVTADRLLPGFLASRQNDARGALAAFEKALAADPKNPAAWLLRARAESRLLEYEAALKSLEQAVGEGMTPEMKKEAGKLRVQLLARTGESNRAVMAIQELAKEHAADESLQDALLELQISEGLLAEAIDFATELLERSSDPYRRVQRRLRLGDLFQRADRRDEALAAYGQCLDDAAQDSWLETEVLAQVERVFRQRDDLTGLSDHLAELVGRHPQRASVAQAQAKTLLELGQTDKAIEAYLALLEKQPGNEALSDAYVEALVRAARAKDAVEVLRPRVVAKPQDKELRYRLIQLLPQALIPGEATKLMEEMLAEAGLPEFDHLRIARLYESMDDPKEARRVYQLTVDRFPESPSAQDALASYLHAADEGPAAILIWKRMAEAGGAAQALRVSRALSARNEHEAALEVLENAADAPADETAWLTQKAVCAIGSKRFDLAADWVRELLRRAQTANALDAPMRLALQVFRNETQGDAVLAQLKAAATLPIQERCLLAELLETRNEPEAADAALAAAAEEEKGISLRFHAGLLRRRGDAPKAADLIRQLLTLEGGRNAENLELLTQLLSQAQKIPEALKAASEWKAAAPGSTRVWMEEARLLRMDGRADAAVETLRQAVRKFDRDTAVASALAEAYGYADKWEDAQRIYTTLFEDAEDLPAKLRWITLIAQCAQRRGALSGLVAEMDERHTENPASVIPLLALAEVHRYTSNYEKRRQAMMEAARLRPKDAALLKEIARLEESEGDWRAAVKTLEQAATLATDPKPLQQEIAGLHLRYGEPETGLRLMTELAGGAAMPPREAELMAITMMRASYWESARDLLQRLLAEQPGDYRLRFLLTISHLESNGTELAVAELLKLLNAPEELAVPVAGAGKPLTENLRLGGYQIEGSPVGKLEFWALMQATNQATQYRQFLAQNASRYGGSVSYSGGPTGAAAATPFLPVHASDVPLFATGHLLAIHESLTEERKKEVVAAVKAAGITPANLFDAYEYRSENYNSGLIPRLDRFEELLNDPLYLDLFVQHRSMISQGSEGDRYLLKILEAKRDTDPDITWTVLFGLCKKSPDSLEKYAPELTTMLDQADLEKARWWDSSALHLLQTQPLEKRRNSTVLKELLAATFRYHERSAKVTLEKAGNRRKEVFSQRRATLAALHAAAGDWDKALALMEEDLTATQNDANARQTTNYYYGSQSVNIQPLSSSSFRTNQGIPSWTGYLLNRYVQKDETSEQERALLLAAVNRCQDLRLRLNLLVHLDAEDHYQPLIRELAAKPDANLQDLMRAASLTEEEDDSAGVFELLLRARPLVSSTDERSQVDGALVHAALELKSAGKEDLLKPHLETVKKALLQLRHLMSGSSSGNQEQLADAMLKFDLKEQAASIKKMLAAQNQTRSSTSRASLAGIDSEEFQKQVKSGNEKAAVAMAVAALRRLADSALIPQNYNAGYEARRWQRVIKEGKLTEVVWENSQPEGETITFRQHSQLAFIGLWLGQPEAARDHLLECTKVRPKDAQIRLGLVTTLLRLDRPIDEALEQWKAIDPRDLSNVASQWLNDLQNNDEERLALRMRLGEFALRLAQTKAATEIGPRTTAAQGNAVATQIIQQVIDLLSSSIYEDAEEGITAVPNLLFTPDRLKRWTNQQKKPTSPDLLKQREDLVRQLAETLLNQGDAQSGDFALRLLITLAIRDGNESALDEMLERAPKFIESAAAKKRAEQASRFGMGYSSGGYYSSSSSSDEIRKPLLGEFILGRSFEKGIQVKPDAQWISDLAVVSTPEAPALYKDLLALYTVPEADFVKQATAMLKSHNNYWNRSSNEGDTVLLEVWQRRGLSISPGPLVLASYKAEIDRGSWPNSQGIVAVCQALAESAKHSTLDHFLEELATANLNVPPDQAAAFVRAHAKSRGNHNSRTPSWRVDRYWQSLTQMAEVNTRLTTVAVHAALKAGFQDSDYSISNLLRQSKEGSGEMVTLEPFLDLLEQLGLLKDLPEFDPVPMRSTLDHSLVGAVRNAFRGRSLLTDQLIPELQNQKSFGALLIKQALRTNTSTSQWSELAPHSAAFAKLPEDKRRIIADVVGRLYTPAYDQLPGADRNRLAAPLKPFFESLEKLSEERMNRLATAATFDDLQMNEASFLRELQSFVRRMAKNDHVAAAAMVERAVKLIQDRQEKGEWRGGTTSNGYNQASLLLEKIASDQDTSRTAPDSAVSSSAAFIEHHAPTQPGCFKLLLDLFTQPEQRIYGHMSWHFAYGWGTSLEHAFTGVGGWGAPDDPNTVGSLTSPFLPTLKRGSAYFAVLAYYDLLTRIPPWLAKRSADAMRKKPEFAALADAFDLAHALSAVNGFASEPLPPGSAWPKALRPQRDLALAWMKDEAVNPLVRCAFAAFVVRHCGHLQGSEELVTTGIGLACQSLESRWPITALAWQDTVHAFNRLDTQTDDWKSLARRYLTAYHERCSDDDESRSKDRGYWPLRSSVVAGLEMAALLGDESEVNRWITKFGTSFEKNMGSVLLLVRHGFAKQAAVIAERIVAGCDGGDFSRGLHQRYQFGDAAALEKALPSFRSPLSALVAQIAVATAPRFSHLPGVGDAQSPTWDERATAASQVAEPLGDSHAEQVRHLFQHIDSSPGAIAVLADWAANRSGESADARMARVVKADRYSSSDFRYITAEALAALYQNGDAKPWTDLIQRFAKAFGSDTKKRCDNLHGLGNKLMGTAHQFMRGRPAAELLPLAEAAEALVLAYDLESSAFSGVTRPWLLRQFILALNDQEDALAKRPELKRFQELALRRKITRPELEDLFFCIASGDPQNTTTRPLDDRLKILLPVLSQETPATAGLNEWLSPMQTLRARGLLTGPEMRQHAAVLAGDAKRIRHLPQILQVLDEVDDEAAALALLTGLAAKTTALNDDAIKPLLSAAAYALEKQQPDLARALLKRLPIGEKGPAPAAKAALNALQSKLR